MLATFIVTIKAAEKMHMNKPCNSLSLPMNSRADTDRARIREVGSPPAVEILDLLEHETEPAPVNQKQYPAGRCPGYRRTRSGEFHAHEMAPFDQQRSD